MTQRRGLREAWIATRARWPGSQQRVRLRQRISHLDSGRSPRYSTPVQIPGRYLGFGLHALGDEPLKILAVHGDGSFRAAPPGPARAPDKVDGHLRVPVDSLER